MSDLPTFAVVTDRAGSQLTLYVEGEVDAHTAPTLLEAFDRALAEPAAKVWLDLAAVTFIDSSGLVALQQMHQAVTDAGATFKIADLSHTVDRILCLTGLDAVIPTYRQAANA
jgi:anti-anti-sigma factor